MRRIPLATAAFLSLALLGSAGGIELIPSNPAPVPGETLTLVVSGAPAGAKYYWDFGGDGTVDKVTTGPQIPYTAPAGYQEIAVQALVGDKAVGSARIAISANDSLGAFRQVEVREGRIEVTITLIARVHLVAPGIEESVPSGWGAEVVDDGGAIYMTGEVLQAVWPLELWPDDQVSLTFVLYPGPGGSARLSGLASAYGPEGRVEVRIGGDVIAP